MSKTYFGDIIDDNVGLFGRDYTWALKYIIEADLSKSLISRTPKVPKCTPKLSRVVHRPLPELLVIIIELLPVFGFNGRREGRQLARSDVTELRYQMY